MLQFVSLLWITGQYAKDLWQGRLRSFQQSIVVQASDGVRDSGVGVVGYASHAGDGPGGNLELLGDDDCGWRAVQFQFYTVVQTALAARASVPDGEDRDVALTGDLGYQVGGSGSGGVGLGITRNPGGFHLRCQQGR